MAVEVHTQLEDWAPQHLAERELPGRETPREGVGLCNTPLIFACDNRSGNFPVGLFLRSLLSSSYSPPDNMCKGAQAYKP